MVYAQLAGVPAVYRLDTASAATIGYGPIRDAARPRPGPRVGGRHPDRFDAATDRRGDGDRYILLASVLAGFVRLGFVVRFISRPILTGYIVGSAWLIVISQLLDLFGIAVESSSYRMEPGAALRVLGQTNTWTIGLGIALVGLISCVLVIVTLLFLTPLFEQLPFVALAVIVLVAGIGLFDIPELARLWRIQRSDFVLAIVTALAVAVIGMLKGILIAVVLSLLDVCATVVAAAHGRTRSCPGNGHVQGPRPWGGR